MNHKALLWVALAVILLAGGLVAADRAGLVEILPDRASSRPKSSSQGQILLGPGGGPGMAGEMQGMPGPRGMPSGMPGPGGMPPGMPGMFPPQGAGVAVKAHKEVVAPMIDLMLHDPDEAVRYQAAYTLGNLGEEAVEPLLNLIKGKGKGSKSKANAAYALGLVGPAASEAVPELLKELKGADTDYRRRLLFALYRIVGNARPGIPADVPVKTENASPARRVLDPGLL